MLRSWKPPERRDVALPRLNVCATNNVSLCLKSVFGLSVRRGRAASLPQWLVLDRFDRYRRHVFDQSDLFLNKRLPIFHAGHHAEIACHGGYAIPDLGVSREVAAARLLIRELRFVGVDGFEARLKLLGDVYDKGWANVVVERCVDDLERTMRAFEPL